MINTRQLPNSNQPTDLDLLKLRNIFNSICKHPQHEVTGALLNYVQLGELIQQKLPKVQATKIELQATQANLKKTKATLEASQSILELDALYGEIDEDLKTISESTTGIELKVPATETQTTKAKLTAVKAELETTKTKLIAIDTRLETEAKTTEAELKTIKHALKGIEIKITEDKASDAKLDINTFELIEGANLEIIKAQLIETKATLNNVEKLLSSLSENKSQETKSELTIEEQLTTITKQLSLLSEDRQTIKALGALPNQLKETKTELIPSLFKLKETLEYIHYTKKLDIGVIERKKHALESDYQRKLKRLEKLKNDETTLLDLIPEKDQKETIQCFLIVSHLMEKFEAVAYEDKHYESNKREICESIRRGLSCFRGLAGTQFNEALENTTLDNSWQIDAAKRFFTEDFIPNHSTRQEIDKTIDDARSHAWTLTDKQAKQVALELYDGYEFKHHNFQRGFQQISDNYFSDPYKSKTNLNNFQQLCEKLNNHDHYEILKAHRGLLATMNRLITTFFVLVFFPFTFTAMYFARKSISDFIRWRTTTRRKDNDFVATVKKLLFFKPEQIPVKKSPKQVPEFPTHSPKPECSLR